MQKSSCHSVSKPANAKKTQKHHKLEAKLLFSHERIELSQSHSGTSPVQDRTVVSKVKTTEDEDTLRCKCFSWYNRLGQPTREEMKKRVQNMASSCDIKPSDVDKLEWNHNGSWVRLHVNNWKPSIQGSEISRDSAAEHPLRRNELEYIVPVRSRSSDCDKDIALLSSMLKTGKQHARESSCEMPPLGRTRQHQKEGSHRRESRYDSEPRTINVCLNQKSICGKNEKTIVEGDSLQQILQDLKCGRLSPRKSPKQSVMVEEIPLSKPPGEVELKLPADGLSVKRLLIPRTRADFQKSFTAKEMADSTTTGSYFPSVFTQQHATEILERPVEVIPSNLADRALSEALEAKEREQNIATFESRGSTRNSAKATNNNTSRISMALFPRITRDKSDDPGTASFRTRNRDKRHDSELHPLKRARSLRPDFVRALSFFSSPRANIDNKPHSKHKSSRAI